jgi:hypothetical protein
MHFRSVVIADFKGPEPTDEELSERKRLSDRAELLEHMDDVLRPPPWVYDDMETAIEHAIAGRLDATLSTREGATGSMSSLIAGSWSRCLRCMRVSGRTPPTSPRAGRKAGRT